MRLDISIDEATLPPRMAKAVTKSGIAVSLAETAGVTKKQA
jgi:hypothetical protein